MAGSYPPVCGEGLDVSGLSGQTSLCQKQQVAKT